MNFSHSLPNFKMGIFSCLITGVLILSSCLAGCMAEAPEESAPLLAQEQVAVGPEWAAMERAAIRELLMRQQDAWNAGEIEAFMADYVKSDTLRFTSGASVRYGWNSALERYYTTYPDRAAMGTLTFDDLKIDVLSPEWALVFGSWHLVRGGEWEDIGGVYTLLMTRTPDGWKVLYDHTSQAD